MTPRRALLMAALLPLPLGAAPSPDAALARLEAAEKSVRTLRFSYTQRTLVKLTGEEQLLEGKALFERPSRFRIEHEAPRRLTALSDGKTLWIHNHARGQVLTDRWENWSSSAGFPPGLSPFQEGAGDLRRKYHVALSSRAAGADVLTFTPKDASAWPYTLRVWVDDATGLPARTELESQSLLTSTEVRAAEVNPALPADAFTFKAPQGADVISLPDRKGPSK